MRSAAVTKQGGSPYTPASQQGAKIERNMGRNTRKAGRCEAPANSLVSLLSLSTVALAQRLIDLGFFKPIKRCPNCGCCLGDLQEGVSRHEGRLYYKCSKCRGDSAYVPFGRGSIFEAAKRMSLRQVATLAVCFSEGVGPQQAAQLSGVARRSVSPWYGELRKCVVKRMLQMQKEFGKQGGRGVVAEADEASVASGPVSGACPTTGLPRFSYTRIIGLLVRGSRNLIIEPLPVRVQRYYYKKGEKKTMSGGVVYHDGKSLRPPGPPPLSIPEGRAFLKKYYKGGVLATDSAATYGVLTNKQKLFGKASRNVTVVHGKQEFTKFYGKGIWGGTQFMDGYFGNYKQMAKPRHIRRETVMDHVRESQFWFCTGGQDRLEALGAACKQIYG